MQNRIDEITQKIMESPQEMDGRLLGAIPSPYDKRDFIYSEMVTITEDEEPQDIDYRPDLPPCFDQGKRGSCVASALTWTPKAYAEIIPDSRVQIRPDYIDLWDTVELLDHCATVVIKHYLLADSV